MLTALEGADSVLDVGIAVSEHQLVSSVFQLICQMSEAMAGAELAGRHRHDPGPGYTSADPLNAIKQWRAQPACAFTTGVGQMRAHPMAASSDEGLRTVGKEGQTTP